MLIIIVRHCRETIELPATRLDGVIVVVVAGTDDSNDAVGVTIVLEQGVAIDEKLLTN